MLCTGHHHRSRFRPNPYLIGFVLVENLFWALAATCVLSAAHRAASALKSQARIKALGEMGDAFTDEERERLIRRIKADSLAR